MNLIEEFVGEISSVMTFDNHININTEKFELLLYFSSDYRNFWVERIKATWKNVAFLPFPAKRIGKWVSAESGLYTIEPKQTTEADIANKMNKILLNLQPQEISGLIDDIQDGEIIHHLGYMKVIKK